MTTVGDSFLIAFIFFGLYATAWATSVSIMLLFPNATAHARNYVEASPGKSIGLGMLLAFTLGTIGVVLLGAGALAKVAGWIIVLGLLSIAAVGTAGISQSAGGRLIQMDPEMPKPRAMARAAAYVIGAPILPILGWLFLGPILLFASLGAGWKAVRAPRVA